MFAQEEYKGARPIKKMDKRSGKLLKFASGPDSSSNAKREKSSPRPETTPKLL